MLSESLTILWPTFAIAIAALLLDRLIGEVKSYHPLVGFGCLSDALQRTLNRPGRLSPVQLKIAGVVAMILLFALPLAAVIIALQLPVYGYLLELIGLYFCLGRQSLVEHARAVAAPLLQGDLPRARHQTAMIVSRQTAELNETQISQTTIESVLENGNDACFATLFWFIVAGLPGALLHRLVNTLDAMWGYRTPEYRDFGWGAARFDDLLGWLPARLCALSYALAGKTCAALLCWKTQAAAYDSPNGGPTMAAGAGALELMLGGDAIYNDKVKSRPILGCGAQATATDIERSLGLLNWALAIGLLLALLLALILTPLRPFT